MRGLIYYLPGRRQANREDLVAAGLGYALEREGGPSCAACEKGPDGAAGCVFSLPGLDGQAPGVQAIAAGVHWQRIPGSAAWVGFNSEAPPGPADLVRRKSLDGHRVELADGQQWLVPVARAVDGSSRLPQRLSWDGRTWAPGDVLPRYAELFAAACRAWDSIFGAAMDGEAITLLTEEADVAALALACNYRIGPAEISLLGLFDTDSQAEVIKALLDWPLVVEVCKKKLPAEERSSPPGGGG
jgi:hypothetical protein